MMKERVILMIAVLGLTFSQARADCTSQPWTFANSTVTTNCGNVGVGTTTPGAKLDVGAGATARGGYTDLLVGAGADVPQVEFYGATASATILYNPGGNFSLYMNGPSWREVMDIDAGGNMGLGVAAPADRLHLGNPGPGGITIDTSGAMKGRLVTAVNDWVGMTINARYNGSGSLEIADSFACR